MLDITTNPIAESKRVVLLDFGYSESEYMSSSLSQFGYEIIDVLTVDADSTADTLLLALMRLSPDVVIIQAETAVDDVFSLVRKVSGEKPSPIILFTNDTNQTAAERAIAEGISAYIVNGLVAERLPMIIHIAVTRFLQTQSLKEELDAVKTSLSERKVVERAKGILMQQRAIDEELAYKMLRTQAMNKGKKMVEIAEGVISSYELVG